MKKILRKNAGGYPDAFLTWQCRKICRVSFAAGLLFLADVCKMLYNEERHKTSTTIFHTVQNMRFGEKYEILKKLGSGSSASVFLVRDNMLGKYWAAKVIEEDPGKCLYDFDTCEMEIHILKQLNKAGLPRIVEVIKEPGRSYLILDYVEGQTLRQYVDTYGPVSAALAAQWLLELCHILSYLHNLIPPVIFCDLKPENVMLGTNGFLTLIDFGAAWQEDVSCRQMTEQRTRCFLPADRLAVTGRRLAGRNFCRRGTYGYGAPELFASDGRLDQRADIYSLGALGYFLTTGLEEYRFGRGRIPGRNLMEHRFYKILERCLCGRKEQRWKDCMELAGAFSKILKRNKGNRKQIPNI